MNSGLDVKLLERFENLLSSPPPPSKKKEQVVQDFLEENTEFIPTPNLLNHHLHFQAIVSKFPLGTELITDYVYLTKSSDTWLITLVELETPEKIIFNNSLKTTVFSAEFNAALNQVRSWKIFVDKNRLETLRKLEPLLRPTSMQRNPIRFNYQLIIGRSGDKNRSIERKEHFRNLIDETDINIMTYDSLINRYKHNERFKKNVLRLSRLQYEFKYMHIEPENVFAFIGPEHLSLLPEQRVKLIENGYQIDQWEQGKLLVFNGKGTSSTFNEQLSKAML